MNAWNPKSLLSVAYAAEANYYLALMISWVIAALTLVDDQNLFGNAYDFNNPLRNNLKLVLVYLALAESSVFVYCTLKRNYTKLILVGLFLLLVIGSLEFYGQVNQLIIDQKLHLFFLYSGLSHIGYGVLATIGTGRK
ncbi:MAG: hypothetical protein ACU83N_06920 [Gammaproteobacteria bacterium]